MFDYVNEWLYNLSSYLLLTTAAMQLLPKEEYRKYVQFFCGLVLIVMMIMPLFQLAGIKDEFMEAYHNLEYQQVIKELEEASEYIVEYETDME